MRYKTTILCMFSSILLFSQANTFIRTYNVAGMNGGLALAVMPDGSFVGTGQHSDNGSGCYTYAYRVDECGNILWFNLYGNGGGGVAIDATIDSGVVLSASNGNVIKIDKDGVPEWQRTFDAFGGYVTSVIQTSDTGYLVGSQSGHIVKLDYLGNVMWSGSIGSGDIHALDEFPNGDFMFFQYTGNVVLGRISSLGNFVWQKSYITGGSSQDGHNSWAGEALIDASQNSIIVASNTDLTTGGGVLVTKFDYNGMIINSNTFSSPSGGEFVRSIDLTEHGGYIIGGGSYGLNTSSANLTQITGLPSENLSGRDILLFKIDTNINFQWSSVIGCGGSEKAIGVRANKDNGYTISAYTDGSFFGAGGSNSFDPLFIKTDSLGTVACQQYSPSLIQNNVTLSTSSINSFSPLSVNSSTSLPSYFSVSPSDYYMCLDCSTTPFFSISDTAICVGDTTWFVNNSTGLICNQNWYVDGVIVSGPADSVPFVFSTPGLHNIKLETTCGTSYVDYNLDFYVNNISLFVTDTSDFNGFEISCNGSNDGYIQTYATSPFPPVNYNWSTANSTDSNQFNMHAGTYSLQLTDDYGCIFDTVFVLTEPDPLLSTYTIPLLNTGYNISCYGMQDGFIDLTVSGSVPNYDYQWSNGAISEDINNISAGVYSYVVIDQNGCIVSDTIVITQPILNVQENIIDVSCYSGVTGGVSVLASGSAPPYHIFWDNNIDPSILSSGTYYYSIIDSIGCIYNQSVYISEPDSFNVGVYITDVTCHGDSNGSVSLNVFGGTPPYSYNWFNYDTLNMVAGSYNYTISDSNNCLFSGIALVDQPNLIDVLNLVIDPSCNNTYDGSVVLQISGGNSPYSVDWGISNPDSLSLGTHEFIVTDVNNCIDSNTVTLSSESNIVVNSNIFDITCRGFCDGSIDLVINGGIAPYSINWFGSDPAFLCESMVYFEVIDNIGCRYLDTIQFIAPDSIDLQINQTGLQLEAIATGGLPPYQFEWFNNTGFSSNSQTIPIINNGFYYCVVIDQNNCQSDTASFNYFDVWINDEDNVIFAIYPNPAEHSFVIETDLDSESKLEIYMINSLGQHMLLDKKPAIFGKYSKHVDVTNKSSGIYILKLMIDDTFYYHKIVIK